MGSKTFEGVWFSSYSHDYPPPHIHGWYADAQVIIEVFEDGSTREADRRDSVLPANAKRNDVRRILEVAAEYGTQLWELWEKTHG